MNINPDYMRTLVDAFMYSSTPSTRYDDLIEAGISLESKDNPNKLNDEFLSHISYLVEQGFISNSTPEIPTLRSIGIRLGEQEDILISSVPLYLTTSGHHYASNLIRKCA